MNTRIKILSACVVAFAVLLAACGVAGDVTAPAPVTSLAPRAVSATQVELTWADPADEDFATVFIAWTSTDGAGGSTEVSAGARRAVLSGLRPGTAYSITAASRDASGNTAQGVAVNVTTEALFATGVDIDRDFSRSAEAVHAADLNGDGHIDVVAAWSKSIIWYENDGDGNFSAHTPITLSSSSPSINTVHATDVNGDGYVDLLVGTANSPRGVWLKNDGSGAFSSEIVITNSNLAVNSIYAANIDGGDDVEVLSASRDNFGRGWVRWYKDNGGNDAFENSRGTNIHDKTSQGAGSIYAADVDGDGDLDVISGWLATDRDQIMWHENDGSGGFIQNNVIALFIPNVQSLYATDIDGDGDVDVVAASSGTNSSNGSIRWYENEGAGDFNNFGDIIASGMQTALSVYAADLDGDGDTDVLSASSGDDRIAWYENDGSANFTSRTITTNADGARSVYAIDLDGDGDLDVLSASGMDERIVWYENQALLP